MTFKNEKQILDFIDSCAKLGVKSLSLGELSFELRLSQPATVTQELPQPRVIRNATRTALATEQEGEEIQQQTAEDQEEELSRLSVDDPLEFEERSAQALLDERSDQQGE